MDREEDVIRKFFSEMKQAEAKIQPPEFNLPEGKSNRFRYLAIAATITLAVVSSWYLFYAQHEPAAIEIVIQNAEDEGSASLISSDKSIEQWESPTQSLIDDF